MDAIVFLQKLSLEPFTFTSFAANGKLSTVWDRQSKMAKERTESQSVATMDTSEKAEKAEKETAKASMFERLFAPASVDTSVSSAASDDERSLDSHSHVSTLSGSSDGSDESSCSSSSSAHRFDRELRAKHRSACKNMTVSCVIADWILSHA